MPRSFRTLLNITPPGTRSKPPNTTNRWKMAETATTFSATDMANPTDSQLLTVPAELRNRVYSLVFDNCIHDVTILVRFRKSAKPTSLLLACKQVYQEAIGIFYSNAIIASTGTSDLVHWIKHIPPQHYHLVPEIRYVHLVHVKISDTELPRTSSWLMSAELQFTLRGEEISTEGKQLSVEIRKRRVLPSVCQVSIHVVHAPIDFR